MTAKLALHSFLPPSTHDTMADTAFLPSFSHSKDLHVHSYQCFSERSAGFAAMTMTPNSSGAPPLSPAISSSLESVVTTEPDHKSRPSPDSLRGRRALHSVQPLSLPLPSMAGPSDIPQQQQQQQPISNLIRRVSNKLRRRTPSTSRDQDEHSGPVRMRHRSDSFGAGENVRLGIQNDDLDDEPDATVIDQLDGPKGENTASRAGPGGSENGVVVPDILQRGTAMTRVTRKKKVMRTFKLDIGAARVTWDPTKPSSRFYVDDIKEIRLGADARNYREEFFISSAVEDRWATIIYAEPETGRKLKTLHVIAPTVEIFLLWTDTLEKILRYRTEMMAGLAMQGEKFVGAHWHNYMKSQYSSQQQPSPEEERLSFEDVERLCRRIHVNCSRQFLKEKFKRSDKDRSGYLNFAEFRAFVQLLKEREEIKDIWRGVVMAPEAGMSKSEFQRFLRDVQKVDVEVDQAHVDKVFRKFSRRPPKTGNTLGISRLAPAAAAHLDEPRMTMDAFSDFLLSSSYNPPLLTSVAPQSLDRPLNEYFISSSHNTYLLGRQVAGESSVEGYIRSLQRGCRCVEIDCWDGDDGRPRVTHGHTGTSEVLFGDVVTAIGKYAFLASPYPLILSLEVHCSLEQQVVMANLLRTLLGERLVTAPLEGRTSVLPTPEELKHRILVKVKGSSKRDLQAPNDVGVGEKRQTGTGGVSASPPKQWVFAKGAMSGAASSTTSESEDQEDGSRQNKRQQSTKIAPELGSLGVYSQGQKFANFALPESKTFNHIFSFQEKRLEKYCKDHEKKLQLEKHNTRYLMRVYPSGFRVNSSNFDPIGFWRRGVQMVALNWQTYDVNLQINEAMFASEDDRSGYVLKPPELRSPKIGHEVPGDVGSARPKNMKKLVNLTIDVISAQQLPRPTDHKPDEGIDPYVVVEVFSADDKAKGAPSSENGFDRSEPKAMGGLGAPQKRQTRVVKDDGFHPLFNERMAFSVTTKFESLVFVRFSVYHSGSPDSSVRTLIATYTAKLISLQQGKCYSPPPSPQFMKDY